MATQSNTKNREHVKSQKEINNKVCLAVITSSPGFRRRQINEAWKFGLSPSLHVPSRMMEKPSTNLSARNVDKLDLRNCLHGCLYRADLFTSVIFFVLVVQTVYISRINILRFLHNI